MPPNVEKIRTALEMIPINILRRMIEERNIGVKSRRSDKLIESLLEEEWTDADFDDLKRRLARIQREQQPYSRYIVNIDSLNKGVDLDEDTSERIQSVLESTEAKFDETGLAEPGFQIDDVGEQNVTGVHWTKSINYTMTPLNEVKTRETIYKSVFDFDLNGNILLINCSLPAKARSLITILDAHGITTGSVGHDSLTNSVANRYVQDFVDDFKERLLDRSSQATLNPSDTSSILEVDLVEMLLDESELEDVRIGGRTDIIGNETVKEFREEHDARVVRLEGQFRLDNKYYNFVSGYTDGMGNVSVKKQGAVEERPELVEEAFEFIYDSYGSYFVDV